MEAAFLTIAPKDGDYVFAFNADANKCVQVVVVQLFHLLKMQNEQYYIIKW